MPASAAKEATITLRNGDQAIPIDIDANGTFALPHQPLLSGPYRLTARSPAGTLQLKPMAISPDSTGTDFRFGDARLTCATMWGFMAPTVNFMMRGLLSAAGGCHSSHAGIYFGVDGQTIDSVTIDHWPHPITFAANHTLWRVPLHDASIGNDAKVNIKLLNRP